MLVVTRLDRLARSTLHLCQIASELERKQAIFRCMSKISTPVMPLDGYFFTCWQLLPNLKRNSAPSVSVRVNKKAKERGGRFGRAKQLSPPQIGDLQTRRQQGVLIKVLMRDYDSSRPASIAT